MKKALIIALLMIFGVVLGVYAEDLGELAKKEKARLEALEKEGKKAKVFTNEDIDNIKSKLALEQTGESAETEGVDEEMEEQSQETEEAGEEDTTYTSPEPQETSQQADRQQQLRELREQREQAEQELQEAQDTVGAGGLFHTRNVGDQFNKSREAQEKIDELEQKIQELDKQKNKNEEQPPEK